MDDGVKKITLIKYGDYKKGTKSLSQNPNPKYTPKTLSKIQSLASPKEKLFYSLIFAQHCSPLFS